MKIALPGNQTPQLRKGLIRLCVYACFFLSGFTSLVFEVLWSRQFVTVFGNSSYAISTVLCAYMAGLGLGGLAGGWLADRMKQWMVAYGATQTAIAAWALAIPSMLAQLRSFVPTLPALSPDSLLVSTLARFFLSFAMLAVPCFLMGTTLPLLVRAVTTSDRSIHKRVGALYSWNTLGAACGCLAAGFYMIDTLGLRESNLLTVCETFLVAFTAFVLSKPLASIADPAPETALQAGQAGGPPMAEPAGRNQLPASLLLGLAFLNGLASLLCEVLWIRCLAFLNSEAFVFPTILCVYLLGLGLGGLVYCLLAGRIRSSTRALGIIEVLLGISVVATFVTGATVFAKGPPRPLELKAMAVVLVTLPTMLMGVVFPLLCSVYGRQVGMLGRRIGLLFAVNTAGAMFGSVLPLFVFVPMMGIQTSFLFASVLCGGAGLAVLVFGGRENRRLTACATLAYAAALLLFVTVVPSNLCQRVFLARDFNLARHTDILFYHEGRTSTAIVTQNRVNKTRAIYINGAGEVAASYPHELCFKLLGDLGPMLHPNPDAVLMLCFGGGIAAGATTRLPEVKSLTVVELESSVVEAARLIPEENNGVLQNSRAQVVIDDGRNYLLTAHRKWPVIISDSTHPKSADSWVLYTREFYQLARDRLTDDGIFVEWVPKHSLRTAEFKIIARTFQSVFPHSSLWVTYGIDVNGQFIAYTLLVATQKPLVIDVSRLRDRLAVEPVRRDLEPFGLHTAAGFLDSFICGEDALRQWVGEGPINTDDLPYTQYETRYSTGDDLTMPTFLEPAEDIWPLLTGTGSGEQTSQLHRELNLRSRARRLAFLGRIREACAVLPEDIRYQRIRHLYDGGLSDVQSLLKFYWDNPQGLNYLASLMVFHGNADVSAAQPVYARVLEIDPGNVAALRKLGVISLEAGDLELGETYLRKALELDPGSAVAHNNLGALLDHTGRHAEAMEHWRAAALASPEVAVAADQWGVCLAREDHAPEALFWFKHAIELAPTFLSARLHLASALWQTGGATEALDQVRYVLKIDPENPAAVQMMAAMEGRGGKAPSEQ